MRLNTTILNPIADELKHVAVEKYEGLGVDKGGVESRTGMKCMGENVIVIMPESTSSKTDDTGLSKAWDDHATKLAATTNYPELCKTASDLSIMPQAMMNTTEVCKTPNVLGIAIKTEDMMPDQHRREYNAKMECESQYGVDFTIKSEDKHCHVKSKPDASYFDEVINWQLFTDDKSLSIKCEDTIEDNNISQQIKAKNSESNHRLQL